MTQFLSVEFGEPRVRGTLILGWTLNIGKTLALALVVSGIGHETARAQVVELPFNPASGAKWHVSEQRVRTRSSAQASDSVEGSFEATLEFVDETAEGYILEWTTDSVTADSVTINAGDVDPNFLIGAPIQFVAGVDGSPVRVMNSEQVIDQALAAIESSSSVSSNGLAMARQLLLSTDSETLAQLLLSTMSTVGACHHLQLDLRQPIEMQGMQPGLGGAPPILVHASMTLEDAGSAGDPARVVIRQSLDPESAKASILVLMESAFESTGQSPSLSDLSPFERDVTITCSIDRETGDARSVISEMNVRIGEGRQTDRRQITFERLK